VVLGRPHQDLALKIPTFSTAAEVYVNGKQLVTYGKTGKTQTSSIPSYQPGVVFIPGTYEALDIIIQVSNFHYTKGGAWQNTVFGPRRGVNSQETKRSHLTGLFGWEYLCNVCVQLKLIFGFS